jgi:hypothetical protein
VRRGRCIRVDGWALGAALLLGACGSESGRDDATVGGSSGMTAGQGGSSDPDGNLPNLSSAGSGGSAGSAPSVDCSFAELDPCVKAAVDEAIACLQTDRTGTFAADRLSCAFPEAGGEARFDAPFPTNHNGFQLSFSLHVDGSECASYRDAVVTGDAPSPLELRTTNHVVRFMPGPERMLECDGVTRTFPSADVSACVPGGMQSPELSKDVLLGDADVFFYRFGMTFVFRCAGPE